MSCWLPLLLCLNLGVAPAAPAARPVPGVQNSGRGEQVKTVSKENIFQLIDTLLSLRPLTPSGAGDALSVKFAEDEDSSNEFFTMYEAEGRAESGVSRADLRVPVRPRSGQDGLLSVEFEGLDIGPEQVKARFGDDPELVPPSPRAARGTPLYYVYRVRGAKLSLGFGQDEKLVAVVVDRVEPTH